tara:strand:- start:154 stop:549 length:396 start_codon:yes stop_codon:yes gene_type:complete
MISSIPKPDSIGVLSSILCMIHCIATPFFFIATACTATCCSAAPLWWQWLDYIFLIISLIAVRHSTNETISKFVEVGLWFSWVVLFVLILNVKFMWLNISPNAKFIPAFTLIGFHLYNLKYCQPDKKSCCQ